MADPDVSSPAVRARAREALWRRLDEPHIAPLVRFAEAIAASRGLPVGSVPYPDPDGGGVRARVLFLLNDPGERAQGDLGGSGMLTMLNEDQTSRKQRAAVAATGLDRRVALHWNAVPWPVPKGSAEQHVASGSRALVRLVGELPELRGIVALGRTARLVVQDAQVQSARFRHLEVHYSNHPERSSNADLFEAYRWAGQIAVAQCRPRPAPNE